MPGKIYLSRKKELSHSWFCRCKSHSLIAGFMHSVSSVVQAEQLFKLAINFGFYLVGKNNKRKQMQAHLESMSLSLSVMMWRLLRALAVPHSTFCHRQQLGSFSVRDTGQQLQYPDICNENHNTESWGCTEQKSLLISCTHLKYCIMIASNVHLCLTYKKECVKKYIFFIPFTCS